jgi:GDP-4-dehydro-6-deoxy-D-mannose reductase
MRDFTDVRDVVRAYRLLMEKGEAGQVYNIASGRAVSMQYILDYLLSLSSVPITVKQDPGRMRPSDTSVIAGNAGKLKRATAWEPEIPLDHSLRDILNWWREANHEEAM